MTDHFDVLDAQVHLTTDLDEKRLLAAMDALGIASVMLDEFWGFTDDMRPLPYASLPEGRSRPLSLFAQAAAVRHPDRFAYIQRVERRDPQLEAVMRLLRSSPGARGIRLVLIGGNERAAFTAGAYDEVLELAQELGFPVCVLGVDARSLAAVADRFPQLLVVLDHCGWPSKAPHWEVILEAGALPTVHLKWSHAHRAFACGGDLGEMRRQFTRALEAYGPQKLMWASDITQEESNASWSELQSFVLDNPDLSAEDTQWVLAGTARTVFGWPTFTG